MNRRWLSGTALLTGLLVASISIAVWAADEADSADTQNAVQQAPASFGYEQIVARAQALAAEPYVAPKPIPAFLQELSYTDWKNIRFQTRYALWSGDTTPFEAHFYHPGSFFTYPVTIHTVHDGTIDTLSFSPAQFDYPNAELRKKVPEQLGYAGIKLLHHLNSAAYLDEVASFLGASYFRALPQNAHDGLSARGLAINTATSGGEEFPAFTDFWLVKPEPGAETLTLYALLDSPSVSGAYKFIIDPGYSTVMQVEATLFTRKAITKIGIAPLTSMFGWGENSLYRLNHARPEAHDSDGLLIHDGSGEWLWRPLKNPQKLTINQFATNNVRGFGLLQRDRDFSHYQHLEYEYEQRPNLWVVPADDWGKGVIELVQIPSDSEINDNIIAYWVPADPVKAGAQLHFAYTLNWSLDDPSGHERATTQATRIGHVAVESEQDRNKMQVAIEFDGGQLGKLDVTARITPHVTSMREVELLDVKAVPNRRTGGWRLSFRVPTEALGEPLELRAFLALADGQPLTETWTYTLTQ